MFRSLYFLTALLLLSACDQFQSVSPIASGKIVHIGLIVSSNDKDASQNTSTSRGAKAAQEIYGLLNNNDSVELVIRDEGENQEKTIETINTLIEKDNISALMLALGSKQVLAIKPFLNSIKIPVVILIATHPEVTTNSLNISQICFDDILQSSVTALFARDELLVKSASVIVDQNDPYSTNLGQSFRKKFEAIGGHLTDMQSHANLTPTILQNFRESGTELLYLPIHIDHVLDILSHLKAMKWSPIVVSSDGLFASATVQHNDRLSELHGIYTTDLFSHAKNNKLNALGKALLQNNSNPFNHRPNSYTGLGAEGYGIIYQTLNRCAPLYENECLLKNIRRTDQFEGIMSLISINDKGKAERPIFINVIHNEQQDNVVQIH